MTGYTRSNRELWAKRYRWPRGALEACNAIEDLYPNWSVLWEPGSKSGSRQQRGFYAKRRTDVLDRPPVYVAKAEDLVARIKAADEEREAEDEATKRLMRLWSEATRPNK